MGFQTSRDAWLYNFNKDALIQNVKRTSAFYNTQVLKWRGIPETDRKVDDFVEYDDTKIKWSSGLKQKLTRGQLAKSAESKLRVSLFRPFTKMNLCFDSTLNHRMSVFPITFPTPDTEIENQVICISGLGHDVFRCHIANRIPEYKFSNSSNGGTQCFPFYTYNEDGTNRQENITNWALTEFRTHYNDDTITKWDIFHYTYALLHHPHLSRKIREEPQARPTTYPIRRRFWGVCRGRGAVGKPPRQLRIRSKI